MSVVGLTFQVKTLPEDEKFSFDYKVSCLRCITMLKINMCEYGNIYNSIRNLYMYFKFILMLVFGIKFRIEEKIFVFLTSD